MKYVLNSLLMVFMITQNLAYSQTVLLRFKTPITHQASTLGDLLNIENDHQQWAKLPLQSHPLAGQIIQKDSLISWMKSQLGEFTWKWQGESRAVVAVPKHLAKLDAVTIAQQALQIKLQTHYKRLTIKPSKQVSGGLLINQPVHTKIDVHFPIAKRVCVWLVNDNQQRIPVWFNVQAYQKVLVANNHIAANTILKPSHFVWKEKNIAGLASPPATLFNEKQWLKNTLSAQQILLVDNLTAQPEVIHGQTVQVTVHHSKVRLTTQALALKDGYQGQIIPLKNLINKKTFVARITGIQQAEILS